MMNDCSSIQGSTTSSSSDVTTLTTASSWCSIPTSSRLRVVRLVRPHSRRILVTPNDNPSFGFSIRGGKEFGTGFFVSNVERYNEADQKGLKVGDQILRVNGYRIDDAVHKELIQFISGQDRLTLKVRGIGLIPIKNKENEALSWHAVKTNSSTSASSLCTEDSFRSILSQQRNTNPRSKDVHIVLNVAPRTKLGLGICKGPEWKPGIFIQFTKEKSVAREAGLRPGDQILCVNSIDFSDVLFREAVAVMKSSNKLDMIVRTAAGSDLFPGESSGYNSSASSVTGDQSPCWADISAKRLTVVREEPNSLCGGNDYVSVDYQKIRRKPSCGNGKQKSKEENKDEGTLKGMNKTIIKLSENGTSINHIGDSRKGQTNVTGTIENDHTDNSNDTNEDENYKPIPPPPPPFAKNTDTSSPMEAVSESSRKLADICFVSRQSETKTVIVEVHQSNSNDKKPQQQVSLVVPERKDQHKQGINAMEPRGVNANEETCGSGYANSNLCTAIAQELKKRKEKLHNTAGQQRKPNDGQENHKNIFDSNSSDMIGANLSVSSTLKSNMKISNATKLNRNSSGCGSGSDHNGDDQHSALMDEFKRAHQRMFKNGFQENDRKPSNMQRNLAVNPTMRPVSTGKNLVTFSTYQERQDVLKNTTVMDYRDDQQNDSNTLIDIKKLQPIYSNGMDSNMTAMKSPPPPPPPEFMGSSPKFSGTNKLAQPPRTLQKPKNETSQTSTFVEKQKPPNSPVPDYEYDQVQIRGTIPKIIQKTHPDRPSSSGNGQRSTQTVNTNTISGNRRTMRLGTVTIGEYTAHANGQNQYREPGKFDFLTTTKKVNNETDGMHHLQQPTMLHSELQSTLSKSNLKNRITSNTSDQQNQMEHQSHCHLMSPAAKKNLTIGNVGASTDDHVAEEHEYTNVEKLTRILQCKQNINETTPPMRPISFQHISPHKKVDANAANNSRNEYITGNGILKNGNGNKNTRNSLSKNTEKSISFGN